MSPTTLTRAVWLLYITLAAALVAIVAGGVTYAVTQVILHALGALSGTFLAVVVLALKVLAFLYPDGPAERKEGIGG